MALHQPFVGLARAVMVQLHQPEAHRDAHALAVTAGRIHRLAAFNKATHLLQAANPLRP